MPVKPIWFVFIVNGKNEIQWNFYDETIMFFFRSHYWLCCVWMSFFCLKYFNGNIQRQCEGEEKKTHTHTLNANNSDIYDESTFKKSLISKNCWTVVLVFLFIYLFVDGLAHFNVWQFLRVFFFVQILYLRAKKSTYRYFATAFFCWF